MHLPAQAGHAPVGRGRKASRGREESRGHRGRGKSHRGRGKSLGAARQAEQGRGYCIDCGACASRMPALHHPRALPNLAIGYTRVYHMHPCMLSYPAARRRCLSVSVCLLGSVHPFAENIDGLRERCCRGAPVYVALGAPHAADLCLLIAAPNRVARAHARQGTGPRRRALECAADAISQESRHPTR